MKDIGILVLLAIDLYLMVTASMVIALLAFVIGLLFLFHYVFELQEKIKPTKKG